MTQWILPNCYLCLLPISYTTWIDIELLYKLSRATFPRKGSFITQWRFKFPKLWGFFSLKKHNWNVGNLTSKQKFAIFFYPMTIAITIVTLRQDCVAFMSQPYWVEVMVEVDIEAEVDLNRRLKWGWDEIKSKFSWTWVELELR